MVLPECGNLVVTPHPDFRIFACMNPPTLPPISPTKENGNTNTNKIRQRGADTIQSLTGLDRSKSDVDDKWDPTGSDNWYFVNSNFQGTNGSGGSAKNAANKGTFSVAIENWNPDTNAITNKIEGSATVAKD